MSLTDITIFSVSLGLILGACLYITNAVARAIAQHHSDELSRKAEQDYHAWRATVGYERPRIVPSRKEAPEKKHNPGR